MVANIKRLQFTFTSVREQRKRVALLERSGYRVVFQRDGYVVLHRRPSRSGAADELLPEAANECRRPDQDPGPSAPEVADGNGTAIRGTRRAGCSGS